jgi:ribosomal-protein-alanine N-acetyltransferase
VNLENLIIRPMVEQDIVAVCAIESAVQINPWDEGIFRDCLKVGYECWVVEQAAEIAAFGILNIVPKVKEGHVMNFCVKPAYQHQGIGRFLLRYLLQSAANRVEQIFLEVRRSNAVALRLYQSIGFVIIGERKAYYAGLKAREDAIILSFRLR